MKSLIVNVSAEHGITEKVARAISDVLGADLREVKDVDLSTIHDCDQMGFGSGIYKGNFHARLLKLVSGRTHLLVNSKLFLGHHILYISG